MDFIVRIIQKFDLIRVIIDKLKYHVHFLPINIRYLLEKLTELYER